MYDMELEKLASKWVERCEFAHPDPKIYREYKDTGQNLAVTGGSRRDLLAMAARWHSEVSDYDYNSNSCKPGKLCGHYTQVSGIFELVLKSDDNLGTLTKKPLLLIHLDGVE